MRCVAFLVFEIRFVLGIYYTMTDISLNIPSRTENLLTTNYPIIPVYIAGNDQADRNHVRFSLNETKNYLQVNPTTGDVFLTPIISRSNIKEIGKITGTSHVEDIDNGRGDNAQLEVNILPMDELDCDKIVEDICFWNSVRYRVEEDSGPTTLGSLAAPYLTEICPFYNVNYSLISDGRVYIRSPKQDENVWLIGTTGIPVASTSNKIVGQLICHIENNQGLFKGTYREIHRNLDIDILDVDNHPPTSQYSELSILIGKDYKKEDVIRNPHLIFRDEDSVDVNHYKAEVRGSAGDLLQPICQKMRDPSKKKNQTAVHCRLVFVRDKTFDNKYSLVLQLNDTSLRKRNINSVVQLPIHLDPNNTPEPLTMPQKPMQLYPRLVKTFKTAAPLARVTQPEAEKSKDCLDFQMSETSISQGKQLFNITKSEGIVFVHDFVELRKTRLEFVSLNISWTRRNMVQHDDLEIRIVNEPNETCINMKSFKHFEDNFCSQFATSNACLKTNACGLATGGSASVENRKGPERCMWRGDKHSQNITHLYSTCTPDIKTCPDGICDSLEELHEMICPQDCTKNPMIPLSINLRTGRGIDKASGIVVCQKTNICQQMPKITNKKDGKKNRISTTTSSNLMQSNISRQVANMTTGKVFDYNISKCGTACIIGTGVAIFFLGGTVAIILICWRTSRTNKVCREKYSDNNHEMMVPLSLNVSESLRNGTLPLQFQMTSSLSFTADDIVKKYTPDPKWEFPRSQLTIEQTLGEGEFGVVLRAKAYNILGITGYTTVAVKTLKEDAREIELNDLLSEYQLLKEISHPNVISLLGVCTAPGGPVYIIIEYAEYGSLRNYLRLSRKLLCDGTLITAAQTDDNEFHYDEPKTSSVTPKDLLSFGWQICNGMSYLSDIKLVHRDLAARNVLLSTNKICKISDFGLTRDVYEDNAYLKRSKGRVPVKWMAPESLADHIYTTKSDVWSFGILIWELVTLGATPYPGIAVQNLFHLLKQGYRMERPDNCSPALYNIMRSCWKIDPEMRPSFQDLIKCWEKLLEDKTEYVNLSNNAIHNRGYFISPFEEKEENTADDEFSGISPLNYLSRAQSYEKCGELDKILNNELATDIPHKAASTQGYETPVKVANKVQHANNQGPEEYTDMSSK